MPKDEQQLCKNEVKDLCDRDHVAPFDVDYVESISKQLEKGRTLTPSQIAVVHNIWDRYFGGR